ncbi:MAG TPA: ankyrin repeat domain-containing protein [Chthonomonadales bacterium]|nr:ankyrin repeat domain-containing protein [Chthonomonadales bacterium]
MTGNWAASPLSKCERIVVLLVLATWIAMLASLPAWMRRDTRVLALSSAVLSGNIAEVRACLRDRTDVDRPGLEGATAVQLAVFQNRMDIVLVLLDHGANSGLALKWAALDDRDDILALLLAKGVSPNPHPWQGPSPLAIAQSRGNQRAVAILKRAGARFY